MTNLISDTNKLNASFDDLRLNETEHVLAALWTEILQTEDPIKPIDKFFELGGNSIDMVMLLFRIQEEFSIELADGAIFQAESLRELAKLVKAAREVSQPK